MQYTYIFQPCFSLLLLFPYRERSNLIRLEGNVDESMTYYFLLATPNERRNTHMHICIYGYIYIYAHMYTIS